MTTVYWHPMGDADLLRRQIDRVFNEATNTLVKENDSERYLAESKKRLWYPAVELVETPEAFHLRAFLPAVTPDSLDIQVSRQAVAISGDRPAPELGDQQRMLFSEVSYGAFQRIVELPAEVRLDEVEADFQNGLLTVTLPKADLPRTIKVRVGALASADSQQALKASSEEAVYA